MNLENRQAILGERVRARRQELGLSQEQLSEKAGLDRTYVSSLESGRRNPAFSTLLKLASALEIDLSELFREKGQ